MAKTKEELEALQKEVEGLNEKCQELTLEDLEQVSGGVQQPPFNPGSGLGLAMGG